MDHTGILGRLSAMQLFVPLLKVCELEADFLLNYSVIHKARGKQDMRL